MGLNRKIKALSEAGADVATLLADRLEPSDGLVWFHAFEMFNLGGFAWTSVYSNPGVYWVQRVAAGAETHYFVISLSDMARTRDAQGLKVLDVVFCYLVSTVDATTIDVTVNQTIHGQGVLSVSSYGGTPTYDSAHSTNATRVAKGTVQAVKVSLPVPKYQNDDMGWVSAEFKLVIPNTCLFKMFGGGFHVAHALI